MDGFIYWTVKKAKTLTLMIFLSIIKNFHFSEKVFLRSNLREAH